MQDLCTFYSTLKFSPSDVHRCFTQTFFGVQKAVQTCELAFKLCKTCKHLPAICYKAQVKLIINYQIDSLFFITSSQDYHGNMKTFECISLFLNEFFFLEISAGLP